MSEASAWSIVSRFSPRLQVWGRLGALFVGASACSHGSVEAEEGTEPRDTSAVPSSTQTERAGTTTGLESTASGSSTSATSEPLSDGSSTVRLESSVVSTLLVSEPTSGDAGDAASSTQSTQTPTSSSMLTSLLQEDGGFDAGPGDAATSWSSGTSGETTTWQGPPIVAHSGFIDIEPIEYVRHGVARSSSSARLFYSFRPADNAAHDAPTFVFFNGGPGYATSLGLMSYGTAPTTVQTWEEGGAVVANPWSWTKLGNLLYLDARQSGFSYSTVAGVSDGALRAAEATSRNFNEYLDAADLVRTMLRALAATPGVQDNPIVVVGESFGGVRATLLIKYMLDYAELRTASWYQDPTLADEISAHYDAIGSTVASEDPRDQLQAQVLVQPFIAHTQFDDQALAMCEPGTPEAVAALQAGVSCTDLRYVRDPYQFDEDVGWSDELDFVAGSHLLDATSLPLMLGVDPLTISGLRATERTEAFRLFEEYRASPVQASFLEAFGQLQTWDKYHVSLHAGDFNDDIYTNVYPCVFFAQALARVETFVTNGELDLVVDTPVLPTTMMNCQQFVTRPFVDGVQIVTEPTGEEARPGQWVVTLNADAPKGAGQRIVRFPSYAAAGHMVAVRQPGELFEDVSDFLREHAIIE